MITPGLPIYLLLRMWGASVVLATLQSAALYYMPWLYVPLHILYFAHIYERWTLFVWCSPLIKKTWTDCCSFGGINIKDYQEIFKQLTPDPIGLVRHNQPAIGMYPAFNMIGMNQKSYDTLDTQNPAVIRMLKAVIGHELAHRYYGKFSFLHEYSTLMCKAVFSPQTLFQFAGFGMIYFLYQKFIQRNAAADKKRTTQTLLKEIALHAAKAAFFQIFAVLVGLYLSRTIEYACDYVSYKANGSLIKELITYFSLDFDSMTKAQITTAIEQGVHNTPFVDHSQKYAWLLSFFMTHPSISARADALNEPYVYGERRPVFW